MCPNTRILVHLLPPATAVIGMASFIFVCSAIVPSAKSFLDLTSSLVSGTSATLLDNGRSKSIVRAVNVSCRLHLVLLVDCKVAFFAFSSAFFLENSFFCFLSSSLSHFLFSLSSFSLCFFLLFLAYPSSLVSTLDPVTLAIPVFFVSGGDTYCTKYLEIETDVLS